MNYPTAIHLVKRGDGYTICDIKRDGVIFTICNDEEDLARWAAEKNACPECRKLVTVDSPTEPEDRGKSVWIWVHGSHRTLCAPINWTEKHEISIPIGWGLVADEEHGVMLENIYGDRIAADAVLLMAEQCAESFRFRNL